MKILAIGDLHGRVPITKKFLRENDVDIVISSGDFPDSNKIRDLIFKNWKKIKKERKTLEQIVGKDKWKKILNKDIESQTKVLKKLDSLRIPFLVVFGNAEHENEIKSFLKKSKNIKYAGSKKVEFNGIYFVGIDTITDETKKQMRLKEKRLMQLFKNLKRPVVLISHEPPYDTKFDIVKNRKSPRFGQHVGSKLVKKIVKNFKPTVNVFGHMHENFGKQKFGKTCLVNTGYGHNGYAALISLDKEKANVKLLKL